MTHKQRQQSESVVVKRAPVREASEVTLDQFGLAEEADIKAPTNSLLAPVVVVEPLRKKARTKKHAHHHKNSSGSSISRQNSESSGEKDEKNKQGEEQTGGSGGLLGDTYDSDE